MSVTPTANETIAFTVKFPKSFSKVPTVHVNPLSSVPIIISCCANNVSKTQFNLMASRQTDTTTNFEWLAVEV